MKKIQFILLVALTLGFVTNSFAQPKNYQIKNGFGISGGITQYEIITDNFETTKGEGWIGGMSATVLLPHRWYGVSYGMQLSESTFGIMGRLNTTDVTAQEIEYKVFKAQLAFLFHIKLVEDFITLDAGPVLQYNSKLELTDDMQEDYFLLGYNNLKAQDISDISNINFNGAIGLSAGFSLFKVKAQYLYGFTNMFSKLNDQDLNIGDNNSKFKGTQSMFAITAMITF